MKNRFAACTDSSPIAWIRLEVNQAEVLKTRGFSNTYSPPLLVTSSDIDGLLASLYSLGCLLKLQLLKEAAHVSIVSPVRSVDLQSTTGCCLPVCGNRDALNRLPIAGAKWPGPVQCDESVLGARRLWRGRLFDRRLSVATSSSWWWDCESRKHIIDGPGSVASQPRWHTRFWRRARWQQHHAALESSRFAQTQRRPFDGRSFRVAAQSCPCVVHCNNQPACPIFARLNLERFAGRFCARVPALSPLNAAEIVQLFGLLCQR